MTIDIIRKLPIALLACFLILASDDSAVMSDGTRQDQTNAADWSLVLWAVRTKVADSWRLGDQPNQAVNACVAMSETKHSQPPELSINV